VAAVQSAAASKNRAEGANGQYSGMGMVASPIHPTNAWVRVIDGLVSGLISLVGLLCTTQGEWDGSIDHSLSGGLSWWIGEGQ